MVEIIKNKVWTVVFHNHLKNRIRIYNYRYENDAIDKVNDLYKDFILNKYKSSVYTIPGDNIIKINDIDNENILCEIHWIKNSIFG